MKKIFKIVLDNKKSIRQKSLPIELPLNDELKQLALDMHEYLVLSNDEDFLEKHRSVRPGVGLAAPQIGRNIRMFAVHFQDENDVRYDYVLVNPKIEIESAKRAYLKSGEGCLSVNDDHPGYSYRAYKITMSAYDALSEKEVTLDLVGYPAIVMQHEYDHLEGILFYDRINTFNPFAILPGSVAL